MRNVTIISALIFSVHLLSAQVIINPGFENWDSVTVNYTDPSGWTTTNSTSVSLVGPSVTRDTSAYAGNYSARVTSYVAGFVPQAYAGIITNGSSIDSLGLNGDPINYKPARLFGFYKFSSDTSVSDSALVVLYLNKYSATMGYDELVAGGSVLLGPANTWTYFEVDVQNEFQNSPDPDNFVIVATSTRNVNTPYESTLWLDALEFGGVLSVADKELEAGMKFYPNPAHSNLFVEVNGVQPDRLAIYGTQGNLLKQIDLSSAMGKYTVDISTLPAGTYFLKAETNSGASWSRPFSVVR